MVVVWVVVAVVLVVVTVVVVVALGRGAVAVVWCWWRYGNDYGTMVVWNVRALERWETCGIFCTTQTDSNPTHRVAPQQLAPQRAELDPPDSEAALPLDVYAPSCSWLTTIAWLTAARG